VLVVRNLRTWPLVTAKYSGTFAGINAAELLAVITAVLPIVAHNGNVETTRTWYVWAANGVVKFVAPVSAVTTDRPGRDDCWPFHDGIWLSFYVLTVLAFGGEIAEFSRQKASDKVADLCAFLSVLGANEYESIVDAPAIIFPLVPDWIPDHPFAVAHSQPRFGYSSLRLKLW
jgi:hypothetical protein